MLTSSGSPLVAGAAAPSMATKHIQVIRPFYWKGGRLEVGQVVEVPALFAAEMGSAGKSMVVEPPKAAPLEEVPQDKPARPSGSKRNA